MKKHLAPLLALAVLSMFAYSCTEHFENNETFSITGTISDPDGDADRFIGLTVKLVNEAGTEIRNENLDLYDVNSSQKTYSLKDVKAGEYKLIIESRSYKRLERDLALNHDTTVDLVLEPIIAISFEPDHLDFGPRDNTKSIRLTNTQEEPVHFYIKGSGQMFELGNNEIADILDGIGGLRRQQWTWGGNLEPGKSIELPVNVFHRIYGDKEFDLNIGTYTYNESYGHPLHVTVSTTDESFMANVQGTVRDSDGKALKGITVYNNSSKSIAITDDNGEYSFGLIPYLSTFSVSAYSGHHYEQVISKEYAIDDIDVDFTLESCPGHLTLDKTEIDLGSGATGSGSTTVELDYTSDLSGYISIDCHILDPTRAYPGFNISPASGMAAPNGKIRFSLDRDFASPGTFSFLVRLKTKDAGTYLLPVKYSVI